MEEAIGLERPPTTTAGAVRAKAPLRISFAGGGTDVMPYTRDHGGAVLSATVDLYAFASLRARADDEYHVSADDGTSARFADPADMVFDGHLDLVKAVLRTMAPDGGLDLHLFSDAPPGSGLGSSSAMVVAMLAAVAAHQRLHVESYDIARRAYQVERVDLRQAGGMQDQYATAFGGFNYIEFLDEDRVIVNPLRIAPDVLNELHGSLLLCHTGITRKSGGILARQVAGVQEKRAASIDALDRIKALTAVMKEALLTGDLGAFAAGLNDGWVEKQRLADGITNDRIDELYATGMKAGALGGKVTGAGGGGFLLLFCPFTKRPQIAQAMEDAGARVVQFHFEEKGVQTWRAP